MKKSFTYKEIDEFIEELKFKMFQRFGINLGGEINTLIIKCAKNKLTKIKNEK